MKRLIPRRGYQVVSENEILSPTSLSTAQGPLIIVIDDRTLSPERRSFLRNLRARFLGAKFLVLSEHPPDGRTCERLRSFDGFVLYADAAKTLSRALGALAQDRLWLPRKCLEHLVRVREHGAGHSELPRLTTRENQVFRLLGDRLSNKEIANRLDVTERTVKFHLGKIFDKLGVHNRHAATELADILLPCEESLRAS